MKLLDLIEGNQIPEVELIRIHTKYESEKFFKDVVSRYSKPGWDWLQKEHDDKVDSRKLPKKLKVKYRDEWLKDLGVLNTTPSNRPSSVSSLIPKHFGEKSVRGTNLQKFYIKCVLLFIFENKELKRILTQECDLIKNEPTSKDGKVSTEVIFEWILSQAKQPIQPEFGLMYELLHFERMHVDREKSLFPTQERKKEEVEVKDTDLMKRLSELEKDFNQIKKLINSGEKEKESDLIKRVQDAEGRSLSFEKDMENLKGLVGRISEVKKENSRIEEKFTKKIHDVGESIKEITNRQTKDFNKQLEAAKSNYDVVLAAAISGQNERLLNAIEENKKGFLRINEETKPFRKVSDKHQNIVKENIFISAWHNYLSKSYEINLTLEEAVIYHTLFKSCSYLVVEEFSIAKSWIEALGMEGEAKLDAASPLWVNTLDWYGLFCHLSKESPNLKIGVVTNFDVALTESYLFPTLEKWSWSGKNDNQKLFLVSSTDISRVTVSNIFSAAISITEDSFSSASLKHDVSPKEPFLLDRYMPKVSSDTLSEWSRPSSFASLRRILVDIPKSKDNILVSEGCYKNFKSVYGNLLKYFTPKSAMSISLSATLEPFLRNNYGEERAINVISYIKEISGNE